MLEHFAVTEDNWREGGKKDSNFLQSESPLFVGRAVAALAADPNVHERTGMLFSSWELARDYGFTDYDGRRPDWGRHKIDFSVLPPAWIDLFRTGADLQSKWLTTLAARTSGAAQARRHHWSQSADRHPLPRDDALLDNRCRAHVE